MCYSAQIQASYRKYVRLFGADVSLREFVRLFWERQQDFSLKLPKAMEADFLQPQNDDEREIKRLIDEFNAAQALKLEQELFEQRTRLVEAERKLQLKVTKAASESKRIATDKVKSRQAKLADLRRTELTANDSRMFPGWYAPVLIWEDGRPVVKPMRYRCRVAGTPAFFDTKFPGTYNARRESLEDFWKDLFGVHHAILIVNAFYENVSRHAMEHRELREGEAAENVVLEFKPQPPQDMLVACLWSRWTGPGQPDLLSFAAITDVPPPEVAAAGHDRCIIPIKPEHVQAWLNPAGASKADLYAILDDRPRPYYEHRLAA